MKKIHSLEPLSAEMVSQLETDLQMDVVQLFRENYFSKAAVNESVEILICRDRDNINFILDNCPNLKFIFIVSVGVEKLPFKRLKEKNIIVANPGGINAPIMSEYVLGAILAFSTRARENILNQEKHLWKKFQCVDSLADKVLLVVGVGHTGKLIAHKAKVFGMYCIGIKKHPRVVVDFDYVDTLDNLNSYLPKADFVVCTLPLTAETRKIFDKTRFCLLKKNAVFINISRSGLIDQTALVACLEEKTIKGAVLDVFDNEPLSENDPLWNVSNLMLTPHSSGRLENFILQTLPYIEKGICAFLKGNRIPNQVNLDNGY
jgi:phosphoglycerate dehydrogenase-like enzyme